MAEAPPTIRRARFGIDMVTIKVGNNVDEFAIHKKLSCDQSPYYATMFRSKFAEAEAQVATEKEMDVEAFALFHAWLYTDVLPVENLSDVVDPAADGDKARIAFYALADKLMLNIDFRLRYMTSLLKYYRNNSYTSRKEYFSPNALHFAISS